MAYIGQNQVVLSVPEYRTLRNLSIVMPFVALGVGATVGYLYAKPYVDTINGIMKILKTAFPFLSTGGK